MGKKFSDINNQSVGDGVNFLTEDKNTADKFAKSNGQDIVNYLATKGIHNIDDLENTYDFLTKASFGTENKTVLYKNDADNVIPEKAINLKTRLPLGLVSNFFVQDVSSSYFNVGSGMYDNIEFAGINCEYDIFSESGNGCFSEDNANLKTFHKYTGMLIMKNGTYRIFASSERAGTLIPSGWTKITNLFSFYLDQSKRIIPKSIIQPIEYFTLGEDGQDFENGYFSNLTINKVSHDTLAFSEMFLRDDADNINIRKYNSSNESFLLLPDKKYYIFATTDTYETFIEIDTEKSGSNLTNSVKRLIGRFVTDANGIINSSIVTLPTSRNDLIVVNYVLPLTGVTDGRFNLIGTERNISTGNTGNHGAFASSNAKIKIKINSNDTLGDMTITGTSVNPRTGIFTYNDSETITVGTSAKEYMTEKRFIEVASITIPTGATIDYDVDIYGSDKAFNRDIIIHGYTLNMMSQNNTNDIRIIIKKSNIDKATKEVTYTILEDIGVDSDGLTNQIIDNMRTGAASRNYNPDVSNIFPNNTVLILEQKDFSDYFTNYENIVWGDTLGEGFAIRLEGSPSGGLSNIDFVSMSLYITKLKEL